jgi:putative FmdB family regulatory protein
MPLYEYFCPTCRATFDTLRPATHADRPAVCPSCQGESKQRILSLVASNLGKNGDTAEAAALPMSGGGGSCCGGACGCHP